MSFYSTMKSQKRSFPNERSQRFLACYAASSSLEYAHQLIRLNTPSRWTLRFITLSLSHQLHSSPSLPNLLFSGSLVCFSTQYISTPSLPSFYDLHYPSSSPISRSHLTERIPPNPKTFQVFLPTIPAFLPTLLLRSLLQLQPPRNLNQT